MHPMQFARLSTMSSLLRERLDKRDCMRRTGKTFSGHRISCRPEYYDQMAIMTEDDHNTYTRSGTCLAISKRCLLLRRFAHDDLTTTADGSQNVKWFFFYLPRLLFSRTKFTAYLNNDLPSINVTCPTISDTRLNTFLAHLHAQAYKRGCTGHKSANDPFEK